MEHTRGAPYHPQTQGKIERYHRSMKNVVKLEKAIGQFVDYYNHQRYHESLDNVTPAGMFYDRYEEIMDRRQLIKQQTLRCRREENLMTCSTY
jgi:transposase InsO family protein